MLVDASQPFSDSGTQSVPDRWWSVFNDEVLNTWVAEALQSNFTLQTAWHRLHEAQAVVERESASLFPSLDGTFGWQGVDDDSGQADTFEAGIMAEYELDLWGRIGAGIESDRYQAQATLADYQTAALTVSAEVVRHWYRLIEAHDRLDLFNQQIATNEKILRLLEIRFGGGQSRSADILRQKQLIESTHEQKLAVKSTIQVLEHRLAVLSGEAPQTDIVYAHGSLPVLPPLPDTGLPLELIQRRPDVQSAFHRLRAADKEVAAAISDRYPRISLTASASNVEQDAGDLFQSWATSFAGNLVTPLLDAGRRGAEVQRTRAVQEQRLYEYGQTILTAFREVEDALIQETQQAQQLESLTEQVRLARQTNERLQYEYYNGADNFIDVLTALTNEQQLQQDLLSAKLTLLESRITLYRALAGAFETEREAANDD